MTAAPIVPGPHDAVATTAAAALAAVLPSSEQLEPGNPQPGTEHVTSLFSAAVVADLGGPISGRVGVLVADELTSALSSSPMGQLDLAAAVQPALDAAAAALGGSAQPGRTVDLDDVVAYVDISCPFCFALHERMERWGMSDRIRWRLIRHASHIVTDILLMEDGALADEVASAARQAPDIRVQLPPRRPDPGLAHAVVVEAQQRDAQWAHRLTSALYRALWQRGDDISSADVLRAQMEALEIPAELLDLAQTEPSGMLNAWQAEWAEADYDQSIPVMVAPGSGRTLIGLPSQRALARFLLGEGEDVATAAACHYQRRPLVVVSGWMAMRDASMTGGVQSICSSVAVRALLAAAVPAPETGRASMTRRAPHGSDRPGTLIIGHGSPAASSISGKGAYAELSGQLRLVAHGDVAVD